MNPSANKITGEGTAGVRSYCLGNFRLEWTTLEEVVPLEMLCDFGWRDNPLRPFLFVSKVLGRHLPTRPNELRGIALQLARNLAAKAPDMPTVFVGMAETATTLGQAVFAAWCGLGRRGLYIDDTRRLMPDALAFSFEESHSHATLHFIHVPSNSEGLRLMRESPSIVIVDDETTTGNTARKLLWEFSKWRGDNCSPTHQFLAVILQWTGMTRWSGAAEHEVVSLYSGSLSVDGPSVAKPWETRSPATVHEACFGLEDSRRGRFQPQLCRHHVICRPGESVLVLGHGEFGYIPLLLAEDLERQGAIAWLGSTTRSPIRKGGAITSARGPFAAVSGEPHVEFLYNVPDHHKYDRVLLCLEEGWPHDGHPLLQVPRLELVYPHPS